MPAQADLDYNVLSINELKELIATLKDDLELAMTALSCKNAPPKELAEAPVEEPASSGGAGGGIGWNNSCGCHGFSFSPSTCPDPTMTAPKVTSEFPDHPFGCTRRSHLAMPSNNRMPRSANRRNSASSDLRPVLHS